MYFSTYFTTKQVVKITGINRKTLHYWISKKIITPSTIFERKTTEYYIWDFKDIVALYAIQKLRQAGITLYDRPLISNIIKCIQSADDLDSLSPGTCLITNGIETHIRQGKDSKSMQSDFYFVIRLGKIIGKLKRLGKDKCGKKCPTKDKPGTAKTQKNN
jgi:hypothetical protein